MKKIMVNLLIVLTILSLMTACASKNTTTSNEKKNEKKDEVTTITWAVFKDPTPAVDNLIKKFEAENKNIKVNLQILPAGSDKIHTALVTSLGAQDDSVDIVSMDIIWPAEFAAADWIIPLDKYFKKESRSEFLKGPIEGVTYKDKVYAAPWYTDAGVLFYRSDIVKTPPKTWDELIQMSKDGSGKNGTEYGFVYQGKQFEGLVTNYLEFLWGNGGQVLKGNKAVVNSPEAVEALQFMVDLVKKEKVSPEGVTTYETEDSRRLFTEGKSVFLRNWPYVWAKSSEAESKISGKVGIAPMPKGPNGDTGAATLGGWNLAISKFSKNQDAAWKFIEFAISEEGQKINAVDGGRIPTLEKLFNDDQVLQKNPHFKDFLPVFLQAKPRPVSPQYPAISEKLQIHVHNALTGQESAKDALDNAAKEINQILKK
ncbi:multiple sugar transport system substrate-binding protein [Bacillus sp. SLBN-46]|uniref:ABC transporter substrate-binding protein n=1 Tax=Bacillus sp. SLBN-46 TaxID=3042283 RepID=UPI00285D8781|nr:ABC transporter substrate-binding protein [Bacillus sp. SLBN-46]MDR6125288.1 multiple sugar transport system substrate-binding protein [Bacillus sp. SLBN-46]